MTIYLLLSLLLVVALLCTAAESARMQTVRASLREVTYMAADSCFAEYAEEIFDDYGLMVLWKQEAELMRDYQSYIEHNLDISDLRLYRDADLQQMEYDGTALLELTHIQDENGAVFLNQIYEYMDYFLLEEIVASLLENMALFQSGEKLAAFVDKVNSYRDVFIRVGTTIHKIQTAIEKIQSKVSNPKALLGNMLFHIARYEETGNEVYTAQFHYYYWNLQYQKPRLEKYLDTILSEAEHYQEASEEARKAVRSLEQELLEDAADIRDESVDVLKQQLKELSLKSGNEEDYYHVASNVACAESMQKQLLTLDTLTASLGNTVSPQELLAYKDLVQSYYQSFQTFDPNALGLSGVSERVRQENSGFLAAIWGIVTRGILHVVTDGKISAQKLDMEELPSTEMGKHSFGTSGNGLLEAGYRKVQLEEYIFGHFGNYREPKKETALLYETEYLLQGKPSDAANLKATAESLTRLREGLNLMSFLKDQQKMRAAENLALGLIGFTGNGMLVEMVKMTVICVWCLAESLCDVKTLMHGGKVPAVKEPQEWSVSAVGLKNFSRTVLPEISSARGMSYKEHLRILLLKETDTELAFRMMDLMQANACKNHNPAFRMIDCITGMHVETMYHAPALFASFPFVSKMVGKRGAYWFSFLQRYAY